MTKFEDTRDALIALRPGAQWHLHDEQLIWEDAVQTQPTQQEIDDWVVARDARRATLNSDTETNNLADRIKNMTAAQIDSWFATNVTNLAQARTVLASIVKYLANQD